MVESEAAFWKITCSTPSGVPQWPNNPRVTLIGDAVHSMTPAVCNFPRTTSCIFLAEPDSILTLLQGGIGANTAVRDSALLGGLLAEAGGYRPGLTEEYEQKMRVYGSEAVRQSYGMATSQFGVLIDEKTSPTVGS